MKKVFVGLSGGVDSSVAAALLKQSGYEVTGVYMKNWTQDLPGLKCPWQQELADARSVATRLDIPFKVYDFEVQYRDRVVSYLIEEYRAGRTPNPDIVCNQEIKFKLFLETALADGADLVATGHYAITRNGELYRGIDDNKDQTYFLYRVNKEALAKVTFPIGEYTKPQVRELARQFGLPTAAKKDSQGICFVGPVGIKDFLKLHVEAEPGPIIHKDGTELGTHDGAIFFTIGQRHGLGVGGGRPYYVIAKDMETNTVMVTDEKEDLHGSDRITLSNTHWLSEPEANKRNYQIRIRHRGQLTETTYDGVNFKIMSPLKAIAPGQSAVIYDGKKVLGGGIIEAPIAAQIK